MINIFGGGGVNKSKYIYRYFGKFVQILTYSQKKIYYKNHVFQQKNIKICFFPSF